jgi:predicted O-linked N-acetylglucosamine transferase (SPINDLY family)
MGVPVVALAGKAHAGRVGVSQLSNLGLTELVGNSTEEYVAIAARLARDLERLSALRTELRSRLAASPLTDAPRFTRNLEQAYRGMWQEWCVGGGARYGAS